MPIAKTIDRLELTRRNSAFLRKNEKHLLRGEECPNCHLFTVIRESGCKKCPACGWNACDWR